MDNDQFKLTDEQVEEIGMTWEELLVLVTQFTEAMVQAWEICAIVIQQTVDVMNEIISTELLEQLLDEGENQDEREIVG